MKKIIIGLMIISVMILAGCQTADTTEETSEQPELPSMEERVKTALISKLEAQPGSIRIFEKTEFVADKGSSRNIYFAFANQRDYTACFKSSLECQNAMEGTCNPDYFSLSAEDFTLEPGENEAFGPVLDVSENAVPDRYLLNYLIHISEDGTCESFVPYSDNRFYVQVR